MAITRMNKFFSAEDFELEQRMGREMIESDLNFTVKLYQIDRFKTQSSDIYGESTKNGIRFKTPVELKVLPVIAEAENSTYNNEGTLRYLQDGTLTFSIYIQQLKELKCDINYGDYVSYEVNDGLLRYYTVTNDGKKSFDNAHTILGYASTYRTILCAPVDEAEFRAI